MGRIENALRNIVFGTFGNFITILLGFVSRTILIQTLGVTYLGINGLYTNILSVLSLAELGIGTAISFSLYKPIADKDYKKIIILMQLYKKVYRIIAAIITVLGLVLVPFLTYFIKNPINNISWYQLIVYYLLFLFNTVTSYFVAYKYSLTNAEQKNYIQLNIQLITSFIILVSQIILLIIYKSFFIYLLASTIINLIQKILVNIYFKKQYPYLSDQNDNQLTKDEIKQFKKNVIALIYHKIGDVSINQTDNIIISCFINITTVGLLSNYNMIITTVMGFLNIIFNTVISGFGNVIATESKEKQYQLFKVYRFFGFWIYGLSILILIFLLTPFITMWIGMEMTIKKSIIVLIIVDIYFKGHRTVINNFKTAAGIFQADKYISIIQAFVNLIVSIVLVQFIGLAGVFVGTIISGLIANLSKPYIIYKMVFQKNVYYYYRESFVYMIVIGFTYMLLNLFSKIFLSKVTIVSFCVMFMIIFICTNVIFLICFFQKDEFGYLKNILKNIFKNKNLLLKEKKIEYSDIINPIGNQNNQLENENEISMLYHQLQTKTRLQLDQYSIKNTKPQIKSIISSMINPEKLKTDKQSLQPVGWLATSLEWTYKIGKDIQDLNCIQGYYDKWVKNNPLIENTDDIYNGYTLIYLHELTKEYKYQEAIEQIIKYIDSCSRDKAGNICYIGNNSEDIYIDHIGKTCPFLCRYGNVYNDHNAIELAILQLTNYVKYGFDSKTGLPYHGYNVRGNTKKGVIGWGIGVGWLVVGIADSIEYITPSNPYYHQLIYQFNVIIKTIVKYQMKSGYYSWQLNTYEGPIDTSATAMISYAIKRGVMLGILNKSFLYNSKAGLFAVCHSIDFGMVKDAYSGSSEFGIYPQQYGSYAHAQGPATALTLYSMNEETTHHNHKRSRYYR